MALKAKKKEFKFTFKVLIRIIIFAGLIYLIISYVSVNKINKTIEINDLTTILGEESSASSYLNSIYNMIPERSRNQLENINQNPVLIFIQKQMEGFPNKQIKEIQKAIIKNIYDNMMENIESGT